MYNEHILLLAGITLIVIGGKIVGGLVAYCVIGVIVYLKGKKVR